MKNLPLLPPSLLFFSIFAVFTGTSAQAQPPLAASPEELQSRVQALSKLAPYSQWKLKGAISLSSPVEGQIPPTGHPQGLSVERDSLALTTRGEKNAAVLNYVLRRSGEQITAARFQSVFSFTYYSKKMNHAGGIGVTPEQLIIPIAHSTNEGGSALVLENRLNGGYSELTRLPFHIGTVLYAPERNAVYVIDWSKNLYTIDLAQIAENPGNYPVAAPFVPELDTEYQDCKSLGGDGYFLCAGKDGSLFNLRGTLDLIHIKPDGTYATNEIIHIPVPRVNPDGSFAASESGRYIPPLYPRMGSGNAPLSFNGFDFEFTANGEGVTLYFAPNDDTNTKLFIYEAPIR